MFELIGLFGGLLLLGLLKVFFANYPANSSEWAAWMQVIGAIGTILGAFGVANHQIREQRRQQRKEAEVRAMLTAANIFLPLAYIQANVEPIHQWLNTVEKADPNTRVSKQMLDKLCSLDPEITAQQIVDLVPLRGDCAIKLAASLGQLKSAQQLANASMAIFMDDVKRDERVENAKIIAYTLGICSHLLDEVITICKDETAHIPYAPRKQK